MTIDEILADYEDREREDLLAVLAFAAAVLLTAVSDPESFLAVEGAIAAFRALSWYPGHATAAGVSAIGKRAKGRERLTADGRRSPTPEGTPAPLANGVLTAG